MLATAPAGHRSAPSHTEIVPGSANASSDNASSDETEWAALMDWADEEAGRPDDESVPEPDLPDWRPLAHLPRLRVFRTGPEGFRFTAKRRGTLIHHCLAQLSLPDLAALPGPEQTAPPDAGTERTRQAIAWAVEEGLRAFLLAADDPDAPPDNADAPPETADIAPGSSQESTESGATSPATSPADSPDRAAFAAELAHALTFVASLPEAERWLRYGLAEHTLIDENGKPLRSDLIVDDGQRLTVVEYKTGGKRPAHHEQVRTYMRLLAATSPLPVEGVLVYLDLRTLDRVLPEHLNFENSEMHGGE